MSPDSTDVLRDHPAPTHKFEKGGLGADTVTCDKCGRPATRGYEGTEYLNLCEQHYRGLARWLDE